MEGRLIGLPPWGKRGSWRWGSQVQTHKKLEGLFEPEAAAVMVSGRENAAFKISCLWKKDKIKRQNVWWRKVWIITIIITDVAVVRNGTGGTRGTGGTGVVQKLNFS